METHPSILAWRSPWTEKPGRLQSTGLQRARHNRATNTMWNSYVVTSQINWSFTRAQGLVVGDCPLRLGSNHTSSVKFSLPYSSKGNFTSFGILVLYYFYKSKYWYFCWYSSMNPQGAGSIILPGFFQMLVLCNSFCPILPPQPLTADTFTVEQGSLSAPPCYSAPATSPLLTKTNKRPTLDSRKREGPLKALEVLLSFSKKGFELNFLFRERKPEAV